MKRKQHISIVQGGYSEPLLQPSYLVTIGLIFLLAPSLGMFWSFMLVSVPAFMIALRIAKQQQKHKYDYAAWQKAYDLAVANDRVLPRIFDYRIILAKPKKAQRNSTLTTLTASSV
jgi:hypothetical protein